MTQPTNKPGEPDKEAQPIYDECWKMYRRAGCPYGRNHRGLIRWVEEVLGRMGERKS